MLNPSERATFGLDQNQTPSQAMVRGAIGRAPALRDLDLTNPAFRILREQLPAELDALAVVLLEHDIDPGLGDTLVEGYMLKRLEAAYGAAVLRQQLHASIEAFSRATPATLGWSGE